MNNTPTDIDTTLPDLNDTKISSEVAVSDDMEIAPYKMKEAKVSIKPRIQNDGTAFTNYLFGSSGSVDKPAWSDSTAGRAAIRLISRGVVGSLFFAVGGALASKALKSYEPELFTLKNLSPTQTVAKIVKNPFHTVAKAVDVVAGTPIKAIWGKEAVRFRPFSRYHNYDGFAKVLEKAGITAESTMANYMTFGRSLGSEVVNVTFDFFCASIGDASTRNIIQAFDPNIKQSWILDSDGNPTTRGHGTWDFGKLAKHIGKSAWRVFSYNAMEDWAAALPYVYFMRWQRQAINNIGSDPNSWTAKHGFIGDGFTRQSDANNPGASVILDENGMRKGTFAWQGALDLHGRFVVYNWLTLMYREAYDRIGHAIKEWHHNDHKMEMPHIGNPITAAIDGAIDSARYITRSFIKANIYMNPAMLFFWPMRVGQSAWKGDYEIKTATGEWKKVRVHEKGKETLSAVPRAELINSSTKVADMEAYVGGKPWPTPASSSPNYYKNMGDPHNFEVKRGPFNSVLNFLGATSFGAGSRVTKAFDAIAPEPGAITKFFAAGTRDAPKLALSHEQNMRNLRLCRERLIRNTVDAAFSYTPYMWAKAETGLRVNDTPGNGKPGPIDKAIDGFLDNAFSLKLGDAWQSVKQIGNLALVEEKSLKSREGGLDTMPEAPKRPSTVVTNIAAQQSAKLTTNTATSSAKHMHESGKKTHTELLATPTALATAR